MVPVNSKTAVVPDCQKADHTSTPFPVADGA